MLTAKQAETMDLVCQGLTNAEIAYRRGVTPQTIKNQLTLIYTNLGVHNRGQAMALWMKPTRQVEDALQSTLLSLGDAADTVSRALYTIRKVGQ